VPIESRNSRCLGSPRFRERGPAAAIIRNRVGGYPVFIVTAEMDTGEIK